uniref:protein-tyrosine-phosphatase n=2 Tax=Lygus hesperus TaxID=30085 RepID=A0A146LCQ6_LYGHE
MKDQVRTPLRTVLRNFLNHIEKLESSSSPEKSYDAEFQDLKLFSESVKTLKEYACTEGEKETNKKKNRYKDILPFDVSRVILNEYAGIPGSDYINANYIKGASGSPAYIASQGPLPCTVNDFWRMVVQCEVQVIVMACNEEEAGKVYLKAKCEKYWVDEGEEKQFGMINVKLLKASTVCPDFSVRTMRLKYTNSQNVIEERTVCQLHYVAWPDHGVPTVVQPLLEMVRLVRDTQASETLPVLVHCSAGCGRTGTICAIDYVWGLLRTGKLTDDFSLLALIREMRKQRIAMVQTKEQYVLVHQAVRELFKEQLLMIDSHPYENVDPDGLLIMKEEENHYDTVENISNLNFEEKKDNTMEKDVAPPLPQKKHTFYPSKQEKDVENLSAQQRSITHSVKKKSQMVSSSPCAQSAPGASISIENPPLLSHSISKKMPNPIPSKGILRVPHLRSINSASPIKRSKSLKLTNSAVKVKMVVSPDTPLELKRRGSLESNIDETGSILDDGGYNTISVDETLSTKDDTSSSSIHNSPRTTQKYDVLNYLEEKRLLVRSLTTFDMRQKNVAPAARLDVGLTGSAPVSRCRLSRSNTQVDFSRHFGGRCLSKRIELDEESISCSPIRKYNSNEQTPLTLFTSKREENESSVMERQYKSAMKRMDEIHGIYGRNAVRGDSKPQSCIVKKESCKSNQLSRIEVPTHLITQSKDLKPVHFNGNISKRTHKEQHPPPNFRQFGASAVPYRDPKLGSFPNDGKNPRLKDMLCANYASPSTSRDLEGRKLKPTVINKHSIPQQYHNMTPINDGHHKFSYLNGSPLSGPVKYDLRVSKSSDHPDPKKVFQSQSYAGKDIGQQMLKKPDVNSPTHLDFARGPRSNPKGPLQTIPHHSFQEKTQLVRKQLDHNNSRLMNMHGSYSPRENEDRYGVDKITVQPSPLSKPVLDVEHNLTKMNSSPTGRIWPPPYRLSELSGERTAVELGFEASNLKIHSDLPTQKILGSGSGRMDVPAPSDAGMKNCDYFSNAPGVDLDQVAASIPQKDASKTNLMKVALEAFSIRRSRQQARLPDSSPSTSSSSKGSSPSSTMGGSKKKQQQYL